jgi:drug/metabolite transporter (DMT)-like permease
VGFVGVLVILQPGPSLLQSFVLLALLATLLYSLGVILVRRISRTENTVSIVFFFTASVTLVSGAFLPFQWVTPSWEAFGLLAALGIIGGLGQLSMTSAFKAAEPSLIVPFEYTTMFWAALYGWWIWGDIPGLNIWVGFVIVSASGIYIALREGDLGLRRGIAKRLYVRR